MLELGEERRLLANITLEYLATWKRKIITAWTALRTPLDIRCSRLLSRSEQIHPLPEDILRIVSLFQIHKSIGIDPEYLFGGGMRKAFACKNIFSP